MRFNPVPVMRPLGISQGVPPAALVGPEELARSVGRDEVVRLGSNESPYGCTPSARRALETALGRVSCYGDPNARALTEALAARHGVSVDEVLVGAGVDDLLGLAVRAYLAPGAPAIMTEGTFPTFEMHVTGYGGRPLRVPYLAGRDAGPSNDLDGLRHAARHGGLCYLANPDNPSGSCVPWSDVAAFVERLPDGCLLIHDEAYAAFIPPAMRAPDAFVDARVIRMRTFSKEYGLAGLRVGYAVASREAVAAMAAVRLLYGVSRLAQDAALASLDDDAFIVDVVARVARARDVYYALGARVGLPTVRSWTNFVLFDCGDETRALQLQHDLLLRGIHIRKPHVPNLARYVRISVGNQAQRDALCEALVSLRGV